MLYLVNVNGEFYYTNNDYSEYAAAAVWKYKELDVDWEQGGGTFEILNLKLIFLI